MFALILTLVSILLVALLAAATIFFGGEAFSGGRDSAGTATLLNNMSQVNAAIELHRATKFASPQTMDDLVPEFLSSIPSKWCDVGDDVCIQATLDASAMAGFLVFSSNVSPKTCIEVNEQLGVDNPDGEPPTCPEGLGSDPDVSFTGCCEMP